MYTFAPVNTAAAKAAVLAIYKQNRDYYRVIGAPMPSADTVEEDINALPNGIDIHAKHFWLIQQDGTNIGVIDLVESYPEKATIYVGLLEIAEHGKGHGRAVMEQLGAAFKQHGYKHLELGVVSDNKDGLAFWTALGLTPVRTVMGEIGPRNEREITVMTIDL